MPHARTLLAILVAAQLVAPAAACPFCAAESRTLTEEMADSSVVLLARLATPSDASSKLAGAGIPPAFVDPETGAARFTVDRVLIGDQLMKGVTEIDAIYFGEPNTEQSYFIRGVGEPPDWAIPLPLSEVAAAYVPRLLELPEEGADRLAFFQQYLQHEDALLSQDAYDEFARASYQAVVDLGPRMDREELLEWIENPSVSPSRRRLFLLMLGVCGEPEDVAQLEEMLLSDARVLVPSIEAATAAAAALGAPLSTSLIAEATRFGERQRKLGLDSLIACYLTLAAKHADAGTALDRVDERYLIDRDVDYSNVYAALQALRFLGEERTDLVGRDRLLQSVRLLLNHPDFADQVIPDLARWEDWSVAYQLADMYEASFDESNPDRPIKYVREPIITYFDVAAEQVGDVGPKAEELLARIEPIDEAVVERARSLRAFGSLAALRKKPDAGIATTGDPSAPEPPFPTEAETPPPPAQVDGLAKPPTPEEPREPTGEADRIADTDAVRAPPAAPSRAVLVGAPLGATAILIGVFWLILRSGGV